MKKQLLIFILLLLFPIFLFSNSLSENKNESELASSAGTMNLDPQFKCSQVPPQHNGDEILDPGDVLRFVIHDNSGATLGNVLDGQGGSNEGYGFFPGMVFGTTYYLSAIAGMDDGTGNVDLTDPELSVAPGTPIVFNDSPEAETSVSNTLDCITTTATLSGAGSTVGADISYFWQGISGNTLGFTATTIDVEVNLSGTYILTVTENTTGCSSSSIQIVDEDSNGPVAIINGIGLITCLNNVVTLDGSASSPSGNIDFIWSNGSNTSLISVTSPGVYSLTVTDVTNGCTAESSFVVVVDTNIPFVDAGPNMTLDCNTSVAILDGTNSSIGPNFVYEWTTPDGQIVSNENTLNPVVNMMGTYWLSITDINNGCSSIGETVVTGIAGLGINLGDDTYFDCNNSEMQIVGNNIPTGTGITYLWSTSDGNIVSGETTAVPTIGSTGTYTLSVDDPNLGCSGSDEIVVYDFSEIVDVNENMTLNCNTAVPNQLDATALLPNLDLTYQWTTTNGNIFTGADALNPLVASQVATYDLTYTDILTGCSGMASIQIDTFLFPNPSLEVIGDLDLDCNNQSVILDASGSTTNPQGGTLSFQWERDGIPFASSAAVTVSDPGNYQVLIFDQNSCLHAAEADVTVTNSFSLPSLVMLNCTNNFMEEVGPVLGPLNPNVTYEWSDANGTIISTDSSYVFTQNMEGVFNLVISDIGGNCVEEASLEVVDNGFEIDIATTVAGCDLEDGTATASTILTNSLVEWSTGEQGNSISDLAQGWYSVTVTDTDNNCSRHDNFYIDEDISCKVVISGYVLNDPNNTCTYDVNLEGVECVMVKLDPLGIYTLTDATGYYEFIVDNGSYTVEFIGSAEVTLQCPLSGTYDVTLNTNGSVSGDNHFFVLRPDFDLCITKFTGNARPGLPQFNCVQICNFSDDVEDAVASFVHDTIFSDQSPWPDITPANGNTIAGNYMYDAATNTFSWNLDDLAPGECRKIMWYMTVPVSAIVGDVISSEAKANPIVGDLNPDNNCLAWTQTVTGSYDPNDKRNFVGETQWGGEIYEDDVTMEYAIRFQNVGNDTAFTVVVRDTLDDEHLDVISIRGFTSSHDMQVQFEDSNVLIFTFNNIMLVDSATNEPASNGWLNFDIDRKPNQPFGTEIINQAAIYFDFNEPVITNELVNVLTDPVSVFSPNKNTLDVEITPTVTDDEIRVHYVVEKTNSVSIQVYNVGGVLLQDYDFGKKQEGEHFEKLSLKEFTSGVYFIFVKTEEGSAVRKVVKM